MSTVSVCIPTYNYARFLPDAIESVLAQTYPDYELLVIDNCSTDDTASVVRRYMERDPRISYIRNDSNLGLTGNLNRCLELAHHDYVKILCADDLLYSNCLEKSVRLLESGPQVVLVSSARQTVSEDLQPLDILKFSQQEEFLNGQAVIQRCLLDGNVIGEPSAVLFRKSKAMRGFSEEYSHIVDLELWLHILEQGDFAFTPEVLCSFRQHGVQGTAVNLSRGHFIDDLFFLIDDYGKRPSVGLGYWGRQRARYSMARMVWNVRKRCSGCHAIRKLWRHYSLFIFATLFFISWLIRPFRKWQRKV